MLPAKPKGRAGGGGGGGGGAKKGPAQKQGAASLSVYSGVSGSEESWSDLPLTLTTGSVKGRLERALSLLCLRV